MQDGQNVGWHKGRVIATKSLQHIVTSCTRAYNVHLKAVQYKLTKIAAP